MAIWRGTGGSGESTSDSSILVTTQKAAEAAASAASALTYKTAAEAAKTAAETAETNAETAATAAASSASTASTKASEASTSATNAASSATAAASSATAAATSSTNAASSATSAAGSASNASTSASTATTKASEASTSATNAASSATSAATSATNAATSATAAASSASSASGSASTATTKASEAATSATNAASSASSASTSETNASNSASAASTSATSAATQASNASSSATNAASSAASALGYKTDAATSATAAATSASNAATSATNASTSASNAASSETAASNSASAANAAKDATLAALDSFDDRYLGSKSTAPTVDNDGNALISGALYFNTTTNEMKVYDGTQWLNAYASLSGALIATNNLSDLTNTATARTNLGLGTAATTSSTDYATAAQGTNADTAYGWGNHASAGYQAGLVSGTNIKTVNSNSLLGSGDVAVGTVTSITAGTGLSGGTISSSGTIDLANTAVTAGSYTNANITVDAQGRLTAASSGSGGGVTSITGTANQITASASTGAVTLSLPSTIDVNTSGNAATATTATNLSGGTVNGITIAQGNVAQNVKITTAGGTDSGISLYNSSGTWVTQWYGTSGSYGFLNGNWAGWDLQKNVNGQLLVTVSGTQQTVLNGGNYTGYNSYGEIYASSWFRSYNATGWYNQTYGGGINMSDTTWVRTYGGKYFYCDSYIACAGNITAYYSDERLKTIKGNITNALDKVCSLNGFIYEENELAFSLMGDKRRGKLQAGLSAQQVQKVLPEVVSLAPFDIETDEKEMGKIWSKSGEDYLTVDYAHIVPLLVEAIKELRAEIKMLKGE